MSGSIQLHSAANAGLSQDFANVGGGRTTDAQEFTTTAHLYEELPEVADPQGILASSVLALQKPRRSDKGVVQRRIGWAGYSDRIEVLTADRLLMKRDDGKYSPSGSWYVQDRQKHLASPGGVKKRVGKMTVQPSSGDQGQSSGAGAGSAPSSEFEAQGNLALAFLPTQVRLSFLRSVREPLLYTGNIIRHERGGSAWYHTQLIRLGETSAVTISALSADGSNDWEVTQYTYDLKSQRQAVGTGHGGYLGQ